LLKRIEIHLLVEQQKRELVLFNSNLNEMVEEKTKAVLELKGAILETMAELVECRDDITGGHIERTMNYLNVMIKALSAKKIYAEEVSSWDIGLIVQSSQLHDVGKIAVKDCILNKPGKLSEEEFEEVKKHTTFGENVINKIGRSITEQEFLNYAKVFAVSHHEKWDGTGYPKGLKGENIPLLGRIMAIADVYDALVSSRPYKAALSHKESVDIILNGRGTHFDPVLVDLFVEVSDKFEEISNSNKPDKPE